MPDSTNNQNLPPPNIPEDITLTNESTSPNNDTKADTDNDNIMSSIQQPNQDGNFKTIITSLHTPEKYGGKKVIATIFVILILVGAIATGTYLVQTRQLKTGQAWDCTRYVFKISREGIVSVINNSSRSEPSQKAKVFINGIQLGIFDVPSLPPGNSAELGSVEVPSQEGFSWKVEGTKDCSNSGNFPPIEIPTSTPSCPPNISASCSDIAAYDENWKSLSPQELNNLKPGDVIRFAVSGIASQGEFDMARFTINGTQRPAVISKKPESEEFYDEYIIPEGITDFNVRAEIHHTILGWF